MNCKSCGYPLTPMEAKKQECAPCQEDSNE